MDREGGAAGRSGLSDTSPEVARRLAALYATLTPGEKLARTLALTESVQELALCRIREQHPEESAREHRIRLMARSAQRELLIAAFGWDPEQRGP